MAENSAIAWCDHTFNPWMGCAVVSPACTNCYAKTLVTDRMGYSGLPGRKPLLWGKAADRHVTADSNWRKPLKWDREAAAAARPALVFCASLADVFEARDDLDPVRARLWELIEATPNLIWLLLTKRPEEILRRVPERWVSHDIHGESGWPQNAWPGTTVENQRYADERIPYLLDIEGPPVWWLSMEPLLEEVHIEHHMTRRSEMAVGFPGMPVHQMPRVNWVITGGETGPNDVRRPFDNDWARNLQRQCAANAVPFFYKQDGGARPGTPGPPDLRIQEWPAAAGDRTAAHVEIR